MNRILKFKEKIISYLGENEQDADLISWMNAQPELDQPDILRALTSLMIENFNIKPDLDREEVLATLDCKTNVYVERQSKSWDSTYWLFGFPTFSNVEKIWWQKQWPDFR
jgi:hypothetical protein